MADRLHSAEGFCNCGMNAQTRLTQAFGILPGCRFLSCAPIPREGRIACAIVHQPASPTFTKIRDYPMAAKTLTTTSGPSTNDISFRSMARLLVVES